MCEERAPSADKVWGVVSPGTRLDMFRNTGKMFSLQPLLDNHLSDNLGLSSPSSECEERMLRELKLYTVRMTNPGEREKTTSESISSLLTCLLRVLKSLTMEDLSSVQPDQVEIGTECARVVRNLCAGCRQNQDTVHNFKDLLHDIAAQLKHILESSSQHDGLIELDGKVVVLLRCCIQMLGNMAVGHSGNATLIWEACFQRNLFSLLLSTSDGTLGQYSCMLIHTCMSGCQESSQDLLNGEPGRTVVRLVLGLLSRQDTEWGLYILETLFKVPSFLEILFDALDDSERNLILDTLAVQLQKTTATQEHSRHLVDDSNTSFLSSKFKQESFRILGLAHCTTDGLDAIEMTKILEVLCLVTSLPGACPGVKEDSELLKVSVNLLHSVQAIGREGNNAFSSVSKVSAAGDVDEEHPGQGLKRDVIRLIANLVYKNRTHQDLVRTMEGIPLIMDNMNIDGRNPFITQWSVFAIRNLMEGNLDNQAVVSDMRLEGLADSVQELRRYGVRAELQGTQVVIKPDTSPDSTPTDR